MRVFMAGAAAIALAASGAYAQGKGNGNGNSDGRGNQPAAAQNKGNGNNGGQKADRGPQRVAQGQRGQGNGNGNAKPDRGNERPVQAQQSNRGNGNDRGNTNEHRAAERGINRDDRRELRVRYDDRRDRVDDRIIHSQRETRWLTQDRNRGLVAGCPPGLAKKRNGCNPPGQVRDRYQRSLFGFNYRPSLFGLNNYDRRGDYYYNDGYLVRYGDSGGIASWLPLLGGALGIGNSWPSGYQSYRVPDYYVDYYDLGGPDRYRYADNVIYRVSPEDAAITSIAALITGDEFTVGQQMPMGYDVYNVPYAYRDRYYDTPEYMYRYSDGYIYQVDPETRLVAAAIDLLT
ncbi:hypothetical protein [Qipengyuania huizhouensis]|uniref:hypothetical protein n=1 Tax=Qipengyuania huizhouensis TaxID=2867245 RepID=UPI001C8863A5|nr:hypothetical protein [Qipengyuania huizhouensis]MBX7459420.1 hypothetical protein [Qipengyuania huizhouensis]